VRQQSRDGTNTVGMGWRGVSESDDEGPWAAFEHPAPPPVPMPDTELTLPPVPPTPLASVVTPARTLAAGPLCVATLSPSPGPHGTPQASSATCGLHLPVTSPAWHRALPG
jgi:hypothetical protein